MEKEASQFKLTPATIRRYIKSGKLKGQKLGVKWFVSSEAISDFLRSPYFPPKRRGIKKKEEKNK